MLKKLNESFRAKLVNDWKEESVGLSQVMPQQIPHVESRHDHWERQIARLWLTQRYMQIISTDSI